MAPILDALAALDHVELFAIVEQDLYPCAPDVPLPIATRTLDYLRSCGPLPDPERNRPCLRPSPPAPGPSGWASSASG